MSSSSLYIINTKYKGKQLFEYANSWLFSPIVWQVLGDKYFKEDDKGRKPSILSPFDGQDAWKDLNNIMNNSENTDERICWELSNQNVFYTKDKDFISDRIRYFVSTHQNYGSIEIETGNKNYLLRAKHINERFTQIAKDIKNLDEKKYPYFVLKNTSCDDSVEYWFEYDEKKRRYKTLKDWDELPAEFVCIENNKIIGFTRIKKENL